MSPLYYAERRGAKFVTREEELKLLASRSKDGRVHPEDLVIHAQNPKSAWNDAFIWDDSVAGHAYRLMQARHMIRVHVVLEDRGDNKKGGTPMRAYVSMGRRNDNGYVPVKEILNDRDARAKFVEKVLNDIEGILEGTPWVEFDPLIVAIEQIRDSQTAKERKKPRRRDDDEPVIVRRRPEARA
jgi:hypothetical protein